MFAHRHGRLPAYLMVSKYRFVISRFLVIHSQLALIQVDMLASVFQASVVKANYSQGSFVGPQQLKTKETNNYK